MAGAAQIGVLLCIQGCGYMVRLPEETRKRIERHLRAYPELSNRALGKAVGVTHTSIGRWRRRLDLPQVPGPRMPEVERLTRALARQYPTADVSALLDTCDPRFRPARAKTLMGLAGWLIQYAYALDPAADPPATGRRTWTPPSEAGDVNQDRADLNA